MILLTNNWLLLVLKQVKKDIEVDTIYVGICHHVRAVVNRLCPPTERLAGAYFRTDEFLHRCLKPLGDGNHESHYWFGYPCAENLPKRLAALDILIDRLEKGEIAL